MPTEVSVQIQMQNNRDNLKIRRSQIEMLTPGPTSSYVSCSKKPTAPV